MAVVDTFDKMGLQKVIHFEILFNFQAIQMDKESIVVYDFLF